MIISIKNYIIYTLKETTDLPFRGHVTKSNLLDLIPNSKGPNLFYIFYIYVMYILLLLAKRGEYGGKDELQAGELKRFTNNSSSSRAWPFRPPGAGVFFSLLLNSY